MLQNIAIIILGLSIIYNMVRTNNRIKRLTRSLFMTDSVLVSKIWEIDDLENRVELLEEIQDDMIDDFYEEVSEEKYTKKK